MATSMSFSRTLGENASFSVQLTNQPSQARNSNQRALETGSKHQQLPTLNDRRYQLAVASKSVLALVNNIELRFIYRTNITRNVITKNAYRAHCPICRVFRQYGQISLFENGLISHSCQRQIRTTSMLVHDAAYTAVKPLFENAKTDSDKARHTFYVLPATGHPCGLVSHRCINLHEWPFSILRIHPNLIIMTRSSYCARVMLQVQPHQL